MKNLTTGLCGTDNYIQNSIITSRLIQEESAVLRGVSGYGVLAELLDKNIEKIDGMAESIGQCVAQSKNLKMYEQQYGDGFVGGIFKRSFTGREIAEENENARRNMALLQSFLVEIGIKHSARLAIKWASDKDKYRLFEQVYLMLYSFVCDGTEIGNKRRAQLELKKIRDSFPLSQKSKKKLIESKVNGDILDISVDFTSLPDRSKMRETISYLLYALYAQKYEGRQEAEHILLDYYSILGYSGMIAKELIRENENQYNHITYDQKRYLNLAQGMVQNFDTCLPTIKIDSLKERAVQMSQYDPYFLPKIRSNIASPVKRKKRISDIFFEDPEMVMHAGATALSQFDLDDSSKENVHQRLVHWGIDGNTSDVIVERSEMMKKNAQMSDDNFY